MKNKKVWILVGFAIYAMFLGGCAPTISRGHENIVFPSTPFNWLAPVTEVRLKDSQYAGIQKCWWSDPNYERCVIEGGPRQVSPFPYGIYIPGSSTLRPGVVGVPVLPQN